MELDNRVALVTGAGHRVGKAIAMELARAGAHIVVHYNQSEATALETASQLRELGVRAVPIQADLGDVEQVDQLFQKLDAAFGTLNILVNSASIMPHGDILALSLEDWQQALDVNLTAPFLCAQFAARVMLARGGGVIINIVDGSALKPWSRYPAHSVSKAGLDMLTRILAKALAPDIRVNAVAPGPVLKPAEWSDERWERTATGTLLKRTGSPSDVARAVRFLIEQDYITGETLVVDGGERWK
jgi:pteridine reductase